jgi:hypothetical protein
MLASGVFLNVIAPPRVAVCQRRRHRRRDRQLLAAGLCRDAGATRLVALLSRLADLESRNRAAARLPPARELARDVLQSAAHA